MVVLDTDHVTFLERGRGQEFLRLRDRLAHISPSDRMTTIISYEEQTRGWLAYVARARTMSQQIDAYRKLNHHLDINVLEFDDRAAAEFQRLRKLRFRVGTMDLKIAAIAISREGKLLSRNLVDFQQIPGLDVEVWTS
jgi:tRNA(fMet)-specific endonuclease VapC